jgi:hypothetical protein
VRRRVGERAGADSKVKTGKNYCFTYVIFYSTTRGFRILAHISPVLYFKMLLPKIQVLEEALEYEHLFLLTLYIRRVKICQLQAYKL